MCITINCKNIVTDPNILPSIKIETLRTKSSFRNILFVFGQLTEFQSNNVILTPEFIAKNCTICRAKK